MFGYWEKEERNRLTDYLYKEMSAEALMLYGLLEFHDYDRKEDTYCSKRNKIMRLPDSAGEEKQ